MRLAVETVQLVFYGAQRMRHLTDQEVSGALLCFDDCQRGRQMGICSMCSNHTIADHTCLISDRHG
jgi:hypothetical protein